MATALLGDHDRAWELLRLINPLRHGATPADIAIWRVEPYVVPADVYGVAPHAGRGGWSWYTGSAGWMYRLISETLLGLERTNDQLRILPRLPTGWHGFTMHYHFGRASYRIEVKIAEIANVTVDGIEQPSGIIRLIDEAIEHHIVVQVVRALAQ
jgi:cyclic beta-1,2-glucan synthetase